MAFLLLAFFWDAAKRGNEAGQYKGQEKRLWFKLPVQYRSVTSCCCCCCCSRHLSSAHWGRSEPMLCGCFDVRFTAIV